MNAAIIDYGMGNVSSVKKALDLLKISCIITNDFNTIREADSIILPGVGAFPKGMQNLEELGLVKFLTQQVMVNKKPFLGICLGMQLIATTGYEINKTKGLGWIDGEIVKIADTGKRVPHLGWNNLDIEDTTYFQSSELKDFYFIHSYHFKVENNNHIAATVDYGMPLVAAVKKDNIFATQFHPEKSQKAGLSLIQNFFKLHVENKSYSSPNL